MSVVAVVPSVVTTAGVCSVPDRCTQCPAVWHVSIVQTGCFELVVCERSSLQWKEAMCCRWTDRHKQSCQHLCLPFLKCSSNLLCLVLALMLLLLFSLLFSPLLPQFKNFLLSNTFCLLYTKGVLCVGLFYLFHKLKQVILPVEASIMKMYLLHAFEPQPHSIL